MLPHLIFFVTHCYPLTRSWPPVSSESRDRGPAKQLLWGVETGFPGLEFKCQGSPLGEREETVRPNVSTCILKRRGGPEIRAQRGVLGDSRKMAQRVLSGDGRVTEQNGRV